MRLPNLLLLLPVAAVASTVYDVPLNRNVIRSPEGLATVDTVEVLYPVGLSRRAVDLGDLIGELTGSIGPLLNLLKPATLNNINLIVESAAAVITSETVTLLKSLIAAASGLLNSDIVGQLGGFLDGLTPVLNALDNGLIDKLGVLLSNASILLTKDFAIQVRDLINSIAPLLKYVGQLIAAIISLLFGGSSGPSGPDNPSTSTTTATNPNGGSGPGATSTAGSDPSLTFSFPDYTPTSTSDYDWSSIFGGGGDDDDSSSNSDWPGSSGPTTTAEWPWGSSSGETGTDSATVPSETSPGGGSGGTFTGAANKVHLGASGLLGALIGFALL